MWSKNKNKNTSSLCSFVWQCCMVSWFAHLSNCWEVTQQVTCWKSLKNSNLNSWDQKGSDCPCQHHWVDTVREGPSFSCWCYLTRSSQRGDWLQVDGPSLHQQPRVCVWTTITAIICIAWIIITQGVDIPQGRRPSGIFSPRVVINMLSSMKEYTIVVLL